MKKLLLISIALLVMQLTYGQLSGIKTIPGDYATIQAAVTDLNAQGVGSGGVTFNVTAGHTETITAVISLTATGTAANPVIFQKSGSGANPLITANTGANTPASAVQDGIWNLVGSDYVTINGIDLYDPNSTNPATMEYGYAFFKAAVDNGCQYNTIKNCTVTLSRENNASGSGPSNEGSKAILVINSLVTAQTTNVTPTAPSGSNSFNMFYTNTLQNCNYGIVLNGYAAATPFDLGDTGNDVGGASLTTGNTILNFGGATGATNPAAGVRATNQWGVNISFNTINNNNGSGVNHVSTLRGIYAQSGTSASATINNNTLTIKSGATTSQVSVIENGIGATAAGNTININNNTITNCTNTAATSSAWYGIYNNAASATNLNMQNNVFTNNSTSSTSGSVYLLRNSGACPGIINITGNQCSFTYNGAAANTGAQYYIYNSSGTTATTLNVSNNSFSNFNFTITGTGTIYFIYNTNSSANLTINGNTWTNLTLNHSGTEYLIYNTASTQVALEVNNNAIVTGYTRTAAAGALYGYYSGASALPTSTQVFSGNNFSNITGTTSGTGALYLIYTTDGLTSPYPRKSFFNNTFTNINYNTTGITYGIYASYLGDGSGTNGSTIYNNTLNNITVAGTFYGIYPTGTVSPTYAPSVYGNTVSNVSTSGAASSIYGYYLAGGGPGLNFYNNKVYGVTANGATGAAYGIYVTSATTTNIYNNLVGDIEAPNSSLTAPAPSAAGMYFGGGTTINAYYNSVYLNTTGIGTNFGTAALYASATPTVTLANNILINASTPNGTGKTVAYQRNNTTLTTYGANSNFNDFYAGTPGPNNLIHFDGTNSYQTLESYKLYVLPRDGFSITENAAFLSTAGADATFLHINPATPSQLESGAINITGITSDYDGNIRQGNTGYSGTGTAPDIGADEFEGIPLDVTPPTIIYTPLVNVSTPGERTLTTSIIDGSDVPTAGIGLPVLYWRINAGAYVAATATYISGTTYTFNFGAGAVMGDVVYYYVCAQDMAPTPNAGSFPSAGASGFTINPPAAAVPPTTPSSYSIVTPLSGDYTVGLAMFNSITGKNITFERSVRRVLKEVEVEVQAKDKEMADATETAVGPRSVKKLVTVEEISWMPMENGQPYAGELYVSGDQLPAGIRETTVGVYPTVTAAIADLNLRGVSGPVNFLLTDASYPTETFPLIVNVNNINKPTATNNVTIKPNTGVTANISGASPAGQIFRILEKYFNINGSNSGGTDRSLTIENTSTTTPQVILVGSLGTSPITGVTIKNCNLINGVTSSSAVVISDGTTSGTAGYFNNITLQNNSIQKAYIGVYSIAVVSAGNGNGLLINQNDLSTAGANNIRLIGLYVQGVDGATISNNIIGNMANTTDASNLSGIWFATGTINSSITGNTITTISGTSAGPRGLAISSANAASNLTISNNTISGLSTSATPVSYGIYFFSTTGSCMINNNMIYNIKNSNSGGYSAIGIALASTLTAANTTAQNNVIYDVAGYGYNSTTTDNGYGFNILSGGGYNLYFNTVRLSTDQTSATGNPACLIISSSVTTAASLNIRNNIFYIDETLGTNKYAVLCNAANTVFSAIDFNDYFTTGPNIGYIGATNRVDLAQWKIGTGKDVNSISVNPSFVSTTDQHPTNVAMDNLGVFITSAPIDYSYVVRTNPPDMGAYEFGINPSVVTTAASGMYCGGGTLNGTVNANGLTVDAYFDYGPTASYGSSIAATPTVISGNTPVPISANIAMPILTTYHYRARCVTSLGVTVYGPDLTITSTDATSPQAATTIATNIAANSATLNGFVNAQCAITAVTFEYGETNAYGFTVTAAQSPVSGSSSTAVSADIAGLTINTTYHFRVKAVNDFGTTYGDDQTFTTGAIPPAVTTVAASNIGNFAATLNGIVNSNNQDATVTFQYGLTNAYGTTVPGIPGTVTGNTDVPVHADISGLEYNTTYHFRCVAQNYSGTTYGADMMFTTLCPIPGAAGAITGPASLCQATSGHVYSVPAINYAYAGYVWTLPPGGTITSGAGTNTITVSYNSSAVSGNVTVYGTSVCGNGAPSSLAVTVNPLPVPTINGPSIACITSTYTYSTQAGMSGYVWTVSAGGQIMTGAGTNTVNIKWNGSGAQSVSVTYTSAAGCPAASPTSMNVTVGTLPTPTIAGSNKVCVNSGLHVYTTQQGYLDYTWTVTTGGTIVSGQGTYQIEVNWTGAGNKTVSVNYATPYGCFAAAPATFAVEVMPLPGPAGPITGTADVCEGAMGVDYSVNTIPNAVYYVWNLPAGVIIVEGENTNHIKVDFSPGAESGNISVYGESLCGAGQASPPYAVDVNPIPPAPVASVDEFFMLHSSAPEGNQWYFNGEMVEGATGQDYQAEAEGFYWTVVTLEGCVSEESNHVEVIFVGLGELKGSSFTIHPVPNDGRFTATMVVPSEDVFSITVYNDLGIKVYEAMGIQVNGKAQKSIDLDNPGSGIYTVVFRGNDQTVIRKVLVTK